MRVVVLGGGYAGVALARRLEQSLPDAVELVLVDATGDHLIQHQLHRLVRYPALEEHLRIPLDELLDRCEVIVDTVIDVESDDPTIALADGEPLSSDYLAVCLGAVSADQGVTGIREYGEPLKTVPHATRIRETFLGLPDSGLAIVGGAGLSGVQVAGELAELRDRKGRDVEIHLLEQEAEVAPRFPGRFRAAVRNALEAAGVEVRTGSTISDVSRESITLVSGESTQYDQLVWTGGITGPRAMNGKRVSVRADLRLGARTFALGDTASVVDDRGERVPASAQAAVRQADTVATNITRLVKAAESGTLVFEPRLARYRDLSPGWVVSVGDDAVAIVGDQVIRGGPAKLMKATVWARYLSSIGRGGRALEAVAEQIGWPAPASVTEE